MKERPNRNSSMARYWVATHQLGIAALHRYWSFWRLLFMQHCSCAHTCDNGLRSHQLSVDSPTFSLLSAIIRIMTFTTFNNDPADTAILNRDLKPIQRRGSLSSSNIHPTKKKKKKAAIIWKSEKAVIMNSLVWMCMHTLQPFTPTRKDRTCQGPLAQDPLLLPLHRAGASQPACVHDCTSVIFLFLKFLCYILGHLWFCTSWKHRLFTSDRPRA